MQVIYGNCLEVLPIYANKIDLIITSPPYFVEKEYEKKWSLDDYHNLMQQFFVLAETALKPGKYLVINFGDYFNSGNRFYEADVPSCYPASVNYFQWGRNAGFDLQATRIWRKQFARMGIPFVCNTHPRPIFDYEHVWTFRKKNGSKEEFVNDRKLSQRGIIGETWTSAAGISKHCAAFPIELPLWAIDVYSQSETDIVLDPFAGSGTTGLACQQRKRDFVLIEKEHKFVKLITDSLGINPIGIPYISP